MAEAGGRALFVRENGEPMTFFMRPSLRRLGVQAAVRKHGGEFLSGFRKGCVVLYPPEREKDYAAQAARDAFYREAFVFDSVQRGALQPLERYRLTAYEPARRGGKKKRKSYSAAEDLAIWEYANGSRLGKGGVQLFKEMEGKKLTAHTWQSMKERYKKQLAGMSVADVQRLRERVEAEQRRRSPALRNLRVPVGVRVRGRAAAASSSSSSAAAAKRPLPVRRVPDAPDAKRRKKAEEEEDDDDGDDEEDDEDDDEQIPPPEQITPPEPRPAAVRMLRRLASESGEPPEVVLFALCAFSGRPDEAARFLRGERTRTPRWTRAEDERLASGSEEEIRALVAARGTSEVDARRVFLT